MMVMSIHSETPPCHSEPFDVLRINSAKNLCGSSNYEILRRPAPAGLLRMTPIHAVSGWMVFSAQLLVLSTSLQAHSSGGGAGGT